VGLFTLFASFVAFCRAVLRLYRRLMGVFHCALFVVSFVGRGCWFLRRFVRPYVHVRDDAANFWDVCAGSGTWQDPAVLATVVHTPASTTAARTLCDVLGFRSDVAIALVCVDVFAIAKRNLVHGA